MTSNYSTVLVDSVTNQIRYIAPKHQFQNWSVNQNPNQSFSTLMAQANACNVMTITSNYVGIGTVSPTRMLHIYGTPLTSQADANNILIDGGGNTTRLEISYNASNTTGLKIAHRNDISSGLWNTGDTYITNSKRISFTSGGIAATAPGLTIDLGNCVGIGTTTASPNTFAVNGSAAFGTYAANATQIATNSVAIGGSLGIGTTNPYYQLHVNGNAYISQTLFASNLTILGALQTTNVYTISTSNLYIDNQSGAGPGLTVRQKTINANGIIADFYDVDVSTTVPVFRISDGGNIGIGTTTAIQKLHVSGTGSTATPTALIIDNIAETGGGNPAQFIQLRNITGGTATDYFGIGSIYSGGTAATKKLLISASTTYNANPQNTDTKLTILQNGNVGIGSTSPSTLLDVTGTVNATTFTGNLAASYLTGTNTLPLTILPLSGVSASTYGSSTAIPIINVDTYGRITSASTTPLVGSQWSNISSNIFVINSNVGIGTQPLYTLDIFGQTRHQHNAAQSIILRNTLNTNNSSEIYFDSTIINANCTASIGIGTDTGASQRGAYWRVNGTDRINILPSNGNVVIGSTGPAFKLDLSGTGNFQNSLTVNYATTTTDPLTGQLYIFNPTNSAGNNCSGLIRVAGGSAGVPYLGIDIANVSGWSIGELNAGSAAANSLVIKNSSSFAGTNLFTFATTGVLSATTFSGSGASLTSVPAASLTGTNTLPLTTLPLSGVSANTYGSASSIPVVTIDTYGRITNASTVANLSSQWSNVSTNVFITGSNIGIGTTNPLVQLHIYKQTGNASPTSILLENTFETQGTNPAQFIRFRESTGASIGDTFGLACSFAGSSDQNKFYLTSSPYDVNPQLSDAKFTLQQGGSIGIGTTTPQSLLHMYSNVNSPVQLSLQNPNTSAYTQIQLTNDANSAVLFKNSSARSSDGTANTLTLRNTGDVRISATSDNPNIYLSAAGTTTINTASLTAALSVYQNGVVTVGNSSAWNKLLVLNDVSVGDTPSTATNFYGLGYNTNTFRFQVPNASTSYYTWYGGSSAMMQMNNGSLVVTGDITAFGTISDKRFKDNIIELPNALDDIMKLNPVSYKWKDDIFNQSKAGLPDIGFIAQEVEPIYPLLVDTFKLPDDDVEYMKVKYEKFVPYIIKAIQELRKENLELKQVLSKMNL
jgi:hypothetical protein